VSWASTGARRAGRRTEARALPPLHLIEKLALMIPFKHRPAPDPPVGSPESTGPSTPSPTTADLNSGSEPAASPLRATFRGSIGHPEAWSGNVWARRYQHPEVPTLRPCRGQGTGPVHGTVLLPHPALARCSRRSPTDRRGFLRARASGPTPGRSVGCWAGTALLGLGPATTCTFDDYQSTRQQGARQSRRFFSAGLVA